MRGKARILGIVSAITIVLLLVISVGLVANRGWIRSQFIPWYAERFYAPGAEAAFKSTFPPITAQLIALGVDMPSSRLSATCDRTGAEFDWLSETVVCGTTNGPAQVLLTPAFVHNWQAHAGSLESYLLTHGWKYKDELPRQIMLPSDHQPLQDVFTTTVVNPASPDRSNDYSLEVSPGVYCGFSVSYAPHVASGPTPYQVGIGESCYHNLVLFGGSNG